METEISTEVLNRQKEQFLNEEILQITMTIESKFPELSKYIGEMPVKFSDTPDHEVSLKNLSSYYDSLVALLENYAPYHSQTI
jgi:hypothetical protein